MKKPLGRKTYGSIPHLPQSRLGLGDHKTSEEQARIALGNPRPGDKIYVQEKLDGSNVAVTKLADGRIVALGRTGYLAESSPYVQQQIFADWVYANIDRFHAVLDKYNGEAAWISGEWLAQSHGTKYQLHHEPFVAFDLFLPDGKGSHQRCLHREFVNEIAPANFVFPFTVSSHLADGPMDLESVKSYFPEFGFHGALEQIEGFVWRVETSEKVDFLCKYVMPSKVDGKYFGDLTVWNEGLIKWLPEKAIKRLGIPKILP